MLPLDLNLSQCKTFQYFMHMRAKSICEFWMPVEKGAQTPYFLVRNETERIPLSGAVLVGCTVFLGDCRGVSSTVHTRDCGWLDHMPENRHTWQRIPGSLDWTVAQCHRVRRLPPHRITSIDALQGLPTVGCLLCVADPRLRPFGPNCIQFTRELTIQLIGGRILSLFCPVA